MRRTIKIPVDFSEHKFLPLMKICASIFNIHVEYAYKANSYNKTKAHHALYSLIKTNYPNIPTGLLQSVRDTAMEAVKSVKLNPNKKPRKSDRSAVRFDTRCVAIRGNLLTISTLGKREKILLKIPKYFQEIFNTWKFTGLQLIYKFDKKKFFIALNYQKEGPDFQDGQILGIDRGLKNIVYCSNNHSVSGKTRNRIKRQYAFNRKKLQAKGTRSAMRHLCRSRQREARFSLNENHIISKEIANLPYQVFVLEKLTGISNKRKGKRMNRKLSNWSYYQLESLLQYKAEALGKKVEFVDARYTSQKCNMCSYTDRRNRNLENFVCKECGHAEHADLNASKNTRSKSGASTSSATRASSGASPLSN